MRRLVHAVMSAAATTPRWITGGKRCSLLIPLTRSSRGGAQVWRRAARTHGARTLRSSRHTPSAEWPAMGQTSEPDELLDALRRLTGRPDAEFRPHQREAVEALVRDRARVLVVQRTGWGKSAVYFLATRLLRDAGLGPTLLISPLLALMRNQIDAATRLGLRSMTINSSSATTVNELAAHITARRRRPAARLARAARQSGVRRQGDAAGRRADPG